MQTEPIKAEAYQNLPDKFRRQHSRFAIGGTGRQETPVAQVSMPMVYDLLYEMGVLDDFQRATAISFWAAQEVVMGIRRGPPRLSEEPSKVDMYFHLVRSLPKKQLELAGIASRPIQPEENLRSMRHGLYVLAIDIQASLEWMQKLMDEFYGCKHK